LRNNLYICFIILLLFNSSCSFNTKSENKPPNIIGEEEFTKLLTNFLIAESATNLNIKLADITKFDSVYAFNPLKQNNISKSKYDSTLIYYEQHPDLYKLIYENALQELSNLQTKRRALAVADSIKLIKKDTTQKNAK